MANVKEREITDICFYSTKINKMNNKNELVK